MEMTLKQRIDRFCEKYPEPEQFKFILYWHRKDGKHKKEIGSGTPLYTWGTSMLTRSTGSPLYVQHYRYDEETHLMECSYTVIKCTVPKSDENRKWEYAERYFIPKEEKEVYDRNGNSGYYPVHSSGIYYAVNKKNFAQIFTRLHASSQMFKKAFMALTDNDPDVPPRYKGYTYCPWILTEWLCHKKVVRTGLTKTQKLVNELTAEYLETSDDLVNKILKAHEEVTTSYNYTTRHAYFDKAHTVFRVFIVKDDIKEINRVYIKNGKFVTARFEDNTWVPNGSFTSSQFGMPVINADEFYSTGYNSYMHDLNLKNVYDIVSAAKNPDIEQLYNMGCKRLASKIIKQEYPNAYMKNIFGEPQKKKNVCGKYNLTKKQFEIVNENIDNYYADRTIQRIKTLLETDNLSPIDEKSFRMYYNAARLMNGYGWIWFIEAGHKKEFIKIAKMHSKHDTSVHLFNDTYSLLLRISRENRPDVDIFAVKNYEELVRLHDMLNEIVRTEAAERNRLFHLAQAEHQKELEKKMVKIDEKRAKFNYEEDEFFIRLPENLGEIVNEGAALHHCVSGYTDSHARGETTILFLRRKSEPDKSFYTIELRNDDVIEQIHGFGNKWLGNNPEAIPTVARWLRKNGIKCSQQILRGTATGYRGNNELVDMPEI